MMRGRRRSVVRVTAMDAGSAAAAAPTAQVRSHRGIQGPEHHCVRVHRHTPQCVELTRGVWGVSTVLSGVLAAR